MNIHEAVFLITGANRGLGKALAEAAVAAGARKVYGGARNPDTITTPGVIPLRLDVTSADDIAAAVQAIPDLTVLVNNAGIANMTPVTAPDVLAVAHKELATNFFAPLALSQAFAPVLGANGGGAIVNVLSVLSWFSNPGTAIYSASKAAAWALTNGLRIELAGQGTHVVGAHMGYMDTDMTAGFDVEKTAPAEVARAIFAALQSGAPEVLADAATRHIKQGLNAEPSVYLSAVEG